MESGVTLEQIDHLLCTASMCRILLIGEVIQELFDVFLHEDNFTVVLTTDHLFSHQHANTPTHTVSEY